MNLKNHIPKVEDTPFYEDWLEAVINALSLPRDNDCYVYFAECEGYLKIGSSTRPRQRVSKYASTNPFEVRLIGLVLGDERHEVALHKAFAHLHHRREWFVCTDQARKLIEFVCGDWSVYEDEWTPTWKDRDWWAQQGSNLRLPVCKTGALPLSYTPPGFNELQEHYEEVAKRLEIINQYSEDEQQSTSV